MVGNSSWKYSWEGRKFKAGKMLVVVEKQLTEVEDRLLAHRHALLLVRSREENHPYLLKIRYELNPNDFNMIDNIAEMKRIGGNHVRFEIDLINLLHQTGHGPKHIRSSYCIQPAGLPYPGGKIWFTIMERVPGEDVNDLIDQLSTEERGSIRKQLAKILQEMADKDLILLEQHPSFLRYDRKNDKLYLIDLTHWGYTMLKGKITTDSPFVTTFGLWSQEELDAEA